MTILYLLIVLYIYVHIQVQLAFLHIITLMIIFCDTLIISHKLSKDEFYHDITVYQQISRIDLRNFWYTSHCPRTSHQGSKEDQQDDLKKFDANGVPLYTPIS